MSKKIYKYETGHYSIDLISQEWCTAKNYVLNRQGYRIEVEKIKERFMGTPVIYYYFVEEKEYDKNI
ncbi:MAG: hypothetical protein IJ298_08850 [Ruminococcus sp.]|nr:hypothetical protein [Ruminococcus sp.]